MKLIFLDIDGVLNSAHGKGPYISDMEIDKLILLRHLIELSNSEGVVLTSDRRLSEVDMKNKLQAFEKYKIKVVGKLRRPSEEDDYDNRGKQIMDYLASSVDDIEKIVILDDNDDGISELFENEFILLSRFDGLDDNSFIDALNKLK